MSQLPGEKYIASNKFNLLYWCLCMVFAIFITIFIGRLYALITVVNPIIFLNVLLLAGMVLLLIVMIMQVNLLSKSRNKRADTIAGLAICSTAWMANWAHIKDAVYGGGFWHAFTDISGTLGFVADFAGKRNMAVSRLGSHGIGIDPAILFLCYLAECVAFFSPVYFLRKEKSYYCEDCDTGYTRHAGYINNTEILHSHPEDMEKGDLRFLQNTLIYKALDTLALDPKEKPGIGAIELHYCERCNAAIVNIKSGVLKQNDKKKREMADASYLLQDTYVTEESKQLISKAMGLE